MNRKVMLMTCLALACVATLLEGCKANDDVPPDAHVTFGL